MAWVFHERGGSNRFLKHSITINLSLIVLQRFRKVSAKDLNYRIWTVEGNELFGKVREECLSGLKVSNIEMCIRRRSRACVWSRDNDQISIFKDRIGTMASSTSISKRLQTW